MKKLGFALIGLAIALAILFLFFTRDLTNAQAIECTATCGPDMKDNSCPHEANSIPLQSYAGFSMSFILAGIGAFMVLNDKKYQVSSAVAVKEKNAEKAMATLEEDEKKVFALAKDSGGAIFQGDLIEKTGFPKVKVSRILDRLEGRGLVERRRRGMANMVVLK